MSNSLPKNLRRFSTEALKLPAADFVPKKYTGPALETLKKTRKAHINPVIKTYHGEPLALHQGYKQWLFDIDGKRYLDMFGGICTVSVGHCHPKISAAVAEQYNTLGHVSNIYLHPKIHEYAEKLTSKLPGNLKVAYFVNSGSEANDLAVLMARSYTGNSEIIALKNCYHGMTYLTMGLTSVDFYKYGVPQVAGIQHIINPDVYKGPWGGSNCRDSPVQTKRKCSCQSGQCEAKDNYIAQLKEVVPQKKLAAFFAESIQGVNGTVQFPKGYIKDAYDIVKQNGGLFISDEVQTGFGRTGEHFWGFEMHGIIPDIVTMAKGIGNGYPLAAVVTTPEVAEALTKAAHFNTFGGNPVASAVGISVLEIIEEEKMQQNCKELGTYLLKELGKLRDVFPIVGDVRGKGLMIGMELVTGDGNTTALPTDRFVKFWDRCKKAGLLLGKGGYNNNVIRIKPPMCISKEDVNFTLGVINESLKGV